MRFTWSDAFFVLTALFSHPGSNLSQYSYFIIEEHGIYRAFHKSVKTLLVSHTGWFWGQQCFFAPESVHTSHSQVNTQFFPPGLSVCLVSFIFFLLSSVSGISDFAPIRLENILHASQICEQVERQRQMEPSLWYLNKILWTWWNTKAFALVCEPELKEQKWCNRVTHMWI